MSDLPPSLLPVTLDDMIGEVRRELVMRQKLYTQWKQNASRYKRDQMDRQYVVMAAILNHLEEARADERGTVDRG